MLSSASTLLGYENLSTCYEWKTLKVGGGGFVAGLSLAPDGGIYVRTDVGGAYRWDGAAQRWIQLITDKSFPAEFVRLGAPIYETSQTTGVCPPGLRSEDLSDPQKTFNAPGNPVTSPYEGVQSLVAAPSDPGRLYMAFTGFVYRSDDHGDTWRATRLPRLHMESNGEYRFQGERLAVDPHNADIVFFGSLSDGLWTTADGGTTWRQVPLEQVPTGPNPHAGIGTVAFAPAPAGGKAPSIYAAVNDVGIFQSQDGGAKWHRAGAGGEGPTGKFAKAAADRDGGFYALCDATIWHWSENHWTSSHPPQVQSLSAIAVDPVDARHIVVSSDAGRLSESHDAGLTYASHPEPQRRVSPEIPWLEFTDENWFSIGALAFSPVHPGELWTTQGIGVWRTQLPLAPTVVWQAVSAGIEEMVTNDIIAPPHGKPLSAYWDRPIFRHEDPDRYPERHYPTSRFSSAWSLSYSAAHPEFIAATICDHRRIPTDYFLPTNNQSGYSTDGGKTWAVFPAIADGTAPKALNFGVLAVSSHNPDNIVWCPESSAPPYVTQDRGKTWTECVLPGTGGRGPILMRYGSIMMHYLHVKPVISDPVTPDCFYIYHPRYGLFTTRDSGKTWMLTSTNVPLNFYNAQLRAVPGRSGHLFLATGIDGHGGVFESSDGGRTWAACPSVTQANVLAFGAGRTPQDFPAIYLQGTVEGQDGVWQSIDAGKSWRLIATYPMGIFDVAKCLDADKEVFGHVYLGFGGSSCVYGVPKE